MTREKTRATSAAVRSRSTPLVCKCSVMSCSRNIAAASNTSGLSSGSPPENSTMRVPSAGNASATASISVNVKSPAPLHFHQSQDAERLLHRLVGKNTTTGRTNVRLVNSPSRTRTLVVVFIALLRLLTRHRRGLLIEKREQHRCRPHRPFAGRLPGQRCHLAFERRTFERVRHPRQDLARRLEPDALRLPAKPHQEIK